MKKKIMMLYLLMLLTGLSSCAKEKVEYELGEMPEPVTQQPSREENDCEIKSQEEETQKTKNDSGVCWIYVCGAVQNPGVYSVSADSRLHDVIEKAGGFTEEADEKSINLAEKVKDESQIVVYTKEEVSSGNAVSGFGVQKENSGFDSQKKDGKINLNTAGEAELMSINGIGPAKAQAILSYREEHGSFTSVEDLQQVDGIKGKLFDKIKDQVTVE